MKDETHNKTGRVTHDPSLNDALFSNVTYKSILFVDLLTFLLSFNWTTLNWKRFGLNLYSKPNDFLFIFIK